MLTFAENFTKMKLRNVVPASVVILSAALLAGCADNRSFKVDGNIKGAGEKQLIIERPGFNGSWIAVDSVLTDSDGSFSISTESPGFPEIYRLRMDGKYVYFPVDSTENISITSTITGYGVEYSLSGSEMARKMRDFDIESLHAFSAGEDSLARFKRKIVSDIILPGKGDILSYYILTKVIDGKPLFSVDNPDDAGSIGAVANMYAQFRPEDPRTGLLKAMAQESRKNRNKALGRKTILRASETALIDFTLPDIDGKEITLSSITGEGKPVLLIFSPLNQQKSPEVNREIAKLYGRYGNSVTFLQVCPDEDKISWREAAVNIPWKILCDNRGTSSPILLNYNVEVLPMFFLYNASGELTNSAKDFITLRKILGNL